MSPVEKVACVILGVLIGLLGMHGCRSQAATPDPKLTPGSTFQFSILCPDERPCIFCKPGYTEKVRSVSAGLKKKICAAYGRHDSCPRGYEIDHMFPLCMGGDNTPENLWPEPWLAAREMDKLEAKLCHDICNGALPVSEGWRLMKEAKAKGP